MSSSSTVSKASAVLLVFVYTMCCHPIYAGRHVRLVDAPAGVTQEEGHTGYLHLPSAVLALIFIARRIQPSLSLVVREVEFWNFVYPRINRSAVGHDIYQVQVLFIFIFGSKSHSSSYNSELVRFLSKL